MRLRTVALGCALLGACGGGPDDARTPAAPDAWTERPSVAARQGQVLYRTYCTMCHGATGRGDGVNAPNLSPPPRDHTDRARMGARRDQDLFAAIRDGHGAAPGGRMPPYGRTLKPYQLWDLVAHLRTLAAAPADARPTPHHAQAKEDVK